MLENFLGYFRDSYLEVDRLVTSGRAYPVRGGVPRFTEDESYSSGNFSVLRERHATLQLDSHNGTTDRLDTVLSRSNWPKAFFKGKTVLECGCGAGPDTEALLSLGAKVVAVDIAGIDVARANLGDRPDLCLVQASIMDLPFARRSFDIVWCHRVLQHTPDPKLTLDHILNFVRPDGVAFVHSYSRDARQMIRWKYALRPLTTRMDPARLYSIIAGSAPTLFKLTQITGRYRIGRWFNWIFVPFLNHAHKPKFSDWSDKELIELGIHETFDALSPKFDIPISEDSMRTIAAEHLQGPFEITTASAVTLLRSRVTQC